MTEVAEKPRKERKDYTDAEVEAGLVALALCSGHRERAAVLVKQEGLDIPPETIRSWATKSRVEDYARIREQVAPRLQAELAEVHMALADGAATLEAKTINRLDERLTQGDVEDKDLANILKSTAVAGGIHVEKAQLLKNLPTQIVKRDASEVLQELQAAMGFKGGEVVDADVIDEEDLGTNTPEGNPSATSGSATETLTAPTTNA